MGRISGLNFSTTGREGANAEHDEFFPKPPPVFFVVCSLLVLEVISVSLSDIHLRGGGVTVSQVFRRRLETLTLLGLQSRFGDKVLGI